MIMNDITSATAVSLLDARVNHTDLLYSPAMPAPSRPR